jgi:hypothetical protein
MSAKDSGGKSAGSLPVILERFGQSGFSERSLSGGSEGESRRVSYAPGSPRGRGTIIGTH